MKTNLPIAIACLFGVALCHTSCKVLGMGFDSFFSSREGDTTREVPSKAEGEQIEIAKRNIPVTDCNITVWLEDSQGGTVPESRKEYTFAFPGGQPFDKPPLTAIQAEWLAVSFNECNITVRIEANTQDTTRKALIHLYGPAVRNHSYHTTGQLIVTQGK